MLKPLILDPLAFSGDFEAHVTVCCDGAELERLEEWAVAAGEKLTVIALSRGRTTVQPMVTLRVSGTLGACHASALKVVRRLGAEGFETARVKIEAAPWSRGVPGDCVAAGRLDPGCHFEHHIKLLLDAGMDTRPLAELVSPHGAHLSWNARRVREDGHQERFVTQRCHGLGLAEAGIALDRLCASLDEDRYHVLGVEREFVVYDSASNLDDGWIEQNGIRQ